jgi:hypothetical protein
MKADNKNSKFYTFGFDYNFSILKSKCDEITNFQFLNPVKVSVFKCWLKWFIWEKIFGL